MSDYAKGEYYARIKWLIVSRIILVSFLLATLIFIQHEYNLYSFPTIYLYYLVLCVYVLTGIYWYLLKKIKNHTLFAYLQLSGDIVLVTFLVYITGGIDSAFSTLYHLTIISASIILYRRGGYLAASLASILHGAMLDMQYYNVFGFIRSSSYTAMQVLYLVFINILSFYTVALLSGYLSERLRKTRQELQEKSLDFNDLRAFQEYILKSIGTGIMTMNLEGDITSWNPAAEFITGFGYDEIRGRLQVVFGDCLKVLFGHTGSLKVNPYRFDGQIIKRDGNTATLGMAASLLKDETEAVRGIILVFQDITKMVQMEERVRRQERLATVGSLAAGIAHEIRNPLASLSGSIQVLRGELDLNSDNRHLMDIVVRETDRLNAIITDFLEYARPKTAKDDVIVLSHLFDETVSLLQNSKEYSEKIHIYQEVDPHIAIRGDSQRLRQVFWNLLINACQAMPNGGQMTISAAPFIGDEGEQKWCEVIIADSGLGVAHEYLDKIFDPFFTTKAGGTGLGLSICYRIVEDYGGTITVETNSGKGAKFKIQMPMIDVSMHAGIVSG
jgi:two-component system sensor histidine kinase PilS (NtrC family)